MDVIMKATGLTIKVGLNQNEGEVYIETTIPSYLVARPSRDLLIAAHQQITRDWWEYRGPLFDLYVSQPVLEEAAAGDAILAKRRRRRWRTFAFSH
jgi:hypothetical protein